MKNSDLLQLKSIPPKEPLVIVATGKYVGEGFDYPRLDTLFLALPISWKGLVAQYAGRLHREYDGKKDVRIYDYIDIHEPVCDNMYRKRLNGYASIGYKTITNGQPSLFGDVIDTEDNLAKGGIFNGFSFRQTFISDLNKAKRSIIISSPKLYRVERNALLAKLCDLMHNGIDIVIMTASESESAAILRLRGLTIKTEPNLSLCASIIDKSIVWYGGINLLGYVSENDNMIRVEDNCLADDLICELFFHAKLLIP